MGIGLRKQIQLVQIVSTQTASGSWESTEGEKFGCWAEVSDPSGFRNYEHGQTQLGQNKRFLVRFKFDKYPNCDWKIRYDGRDWTISEKRKTDEKRFYWSIFAVSKSDG